MRYGSQDDVTLALAKDPSFHDSDGREDEVAVALEAFVGEAHPMIRDSQQDGVAVTVETVVNKSRLESFRETTASTKARS